MRQRARLRLDVRRQGYNPRHMRLMARHARTRAPSPVRVERPRLGMTVDELEELIVAAEDRLEHEADAGRRATLERGRRALEAELGRMLAA